MWFTKSKRLVRFLCFSLTITLISGANIISANQSLSGDQTIISKGEKFELGFFRSGNTSDYYIGIWYKKLPPTIVWVANIETPVANRFLSELKIIDGNLVLLNESKFPIWSTNVTTTFTSAVAVILDDGNLVLREGSSSHEAIWQSFDHPSDTWLPGARLGYDNRGKKSPILTSWKTIEDPAVGLFSLELHLFSNEYVSTWSPLRNSTSGVWNGELFDLVPEMRLNYTTYNSSYITDGNESYFTYSVYDASVICRFVTDVSGQVQKLTWNEFFKEWDLFMSQPRTRCEVYAFGNCLTGFKPKLESDWNQIDFNHGCVRKTDLQCRRNVEKTDFVMISVRNLPPNNTVADWSDAGECHNTCLRDCACDAYSVVGSQCLIWINGDVLDLTEDNGSGNTIYINVASKDLCLLKKSRNLAILGFTGGVLGVLVLGLIVAFLIYRKKRASVVGKTTMEGSLVAFAYKDLQIATKNFSEKVGGGGFGSVFKGVLRDSSIVAVKRLESFSQGDKQFRSEVSTVGIIHHVHLVRLRGFCAEGSNKLLVYDYMANGSLDTHLFRGKQVLNWQTRYQIALGTARGLIYLHEKCRDCIIHCDIKPENILLDADFSPKIADFGLAKIVGRECSRVLTTTRGSIGYLAPEWLSGVPITTKADVYSYGMLLFELVYGRRNAEPHEDSRSNYFPTLTTSVLMEGGDVLSLLDNRLNREGSVEEVTKVCKIACWCIQYEEECRPSMSMVERILEGGLEVNMPPTPKICEFIC